MAYASPSIVGEYVCNDCHGYLTLKKDSGNAYKIWLGVGGGSCGGDVFVNGKFVPSAGNSFAIRRKEKGRLCTTEITIDGKNARVHDTFIFNVKTQE